MKVKNKNLEWYVIIHNSNKICRYNIFNEEFKNKLYKKYRAKRLNSLSDLREFIKTYCMYNYWSRTEYEVLIGGLFEDLNTFEKIDVWYQLELNLDRIVEYINNYLDMNLV